MKTLSKIADISSGRPHLIQGPDPCNQNFRNTPYYNDNLKF